VEGMSLTCLWRYRLQLRQTELLAAYLFELRLSSAVTPKFLPLYLTHVPRQRSLPLYLHPVQRFPLNPSPIPHYNYKISISIHIYHPLLFFLELTNTGVRKNREERIFWCDP
jgi:hypothetical protein